MKGDFRSEFQLKPKMLLYFGSSEDPMGKPQGLVREGFVSYITRKVRLNRRGRSEKNINMNSLLPRSIKKKLFPVSAGTHIVSRLQSRAEFTKTPPRTSC
jgi:hypothetical protein